MIEEQHLVAAGEGGARERMVLRLAVPEARPALEIDHVGLRSRGFIRGNDGNLMLSDAAGEEDEGVLVVAVIASRRRPAVVDWSLAGGIVVAVAMATETETEQENERRAVGNIALVMASHHTPVTPTSLPLSSPSPPKSPAHFFPHQNSLLAFSSLSHLFLKGMAYLHLAHTLADAFNALADEVQTLTDRKTVLEHKLRFAHEQFQYLADKYAPAAPEIAETLAKLQPPRQTSVDTSLPVPLPRSFDPDTQHQIALVIRDGRRVASQLVSLGEASKTTGSSRETLSHTSHEETSMSTTLEQDFTVEGKKGNLQCPFSKPVTASGAGNQQDGLADDATPHHSMDPICAAMYEESTSQPAPNGTPAGKCPIRYMDQHSPEEVAHYVETHKHELPRSHEVCLRRYQRNDEQIKKIDSKYGDIVSMIEGLGQLHQPMLPEAEQTQQNSDVEEASNERVENWAQAVSVNTDPAEDDKAPTQVDEDRESHFDRDRPLRAVRVGESPSRPWGIQVPVYELAEHDDDQPLSPPPAPVRMPSPTRNTQSPVKGAGKCPFDHTKLPAMRGFGAPPKLEAHRPVSPDAPSQQPPRPLTPTKEAAPPHPSPPPQPAFINPDMVKGSGNTPQMIFTGPVFIGYPMEQAIQFMNQYRGNQ
ncbi:hypothetical protein G7046_g8373 [Stylonectria norvegica]|nr:hypothetical protein G7046_g8373 [Stylonectria norvegica]